MTIKLENLKPYADRILVKRIDHEEKTAGGIIIPIASQEKPPTGSVLAVGEGKRDSSGTCIPMDVSVGDVVYFGKYAGTQVDDNHLIIREDEVLGVNNNK